jgi:hypothetical protein
MIGYTQRLLDLKKVTSQRLYSNNRNAGIGTTFQKGVFTNPSQAYREAFSAKNKLRSTSGQNIRSYYYAPTVITSSALPTITSISVSDVSTNSLVLTWQGSDSSNVYITYGSTIAYMNAEETSTVVSNLSANTTYTFTITPYTDIILKNGISKTVVATTDGMITEFDFGVVTDTSVQFAVSGTYSSFIIYANTDETVSPTSHVTSSNTSTVSGLATNTRYWFVIYWVNSAGATGKYEFVQTHMSGEITKFSSSTTTDSSVQFTVDGTFTSFVIYAHTDDTVSSTNFTVESINDTNVSDLSANTRYWFAVYWITE